jgi:hypothetical protein
MVPWWKTICQCPRCSCQIELRNVWTGGSEWSPQGRDDLLLRECAARATELDKAIRQELSDATGFSNARLEERFLHLTELNGKRLFGRHARA